MALSLAGEALIDNELIALVSEIYAIWEDIENQLWVVFDCLLRTDSWQTLHYQVAAPFSSSIKIIVPAEKWWKNWARSFGPQNQNNYENFSR